MFDDLKVLLVPNTFAAERPVSRVTIPADLTAWVRLPMFRPTAAGPPERRPPFLTPSSPAVE
jgi:hypothetical protein